MTRLVRTARVRPFKPGNPGRPPRSKNKITQIIEQLAEGQAEQLIQKVLELAEAGAHRANRKGLVRPSNPWCRFRPRRLFDEYTFSPNRRPMTILIRVRASKDFCTRSIYDD
jgi:hypothetical protein